MAKEKYSRVDLYLTTYHLARIQLELLRAEGASRHRNRNPRWKRTTPTTTRDTYEEELIEEDWDAECEAIINCMEMTKIKAEEV